ncbi:hypothetical protein GCM10022226_60660 [Sphaerisporangium flaviroseum]|uniref:Uncharacterized protein n=1 Tax=Sphaerisporangium flaviroseum TaxID=509199 RepID=A0ABP7J0B8_9ACTN
MAASTSSGEAAGVRVTASGYSTGVLRGLDQKDSANVPCMPWARHISSHHSALFRAAARSHLSVMSELSSVLSRSAPVETLGKENPRVPAGLVITIVIDVTPVAPGLDGSRMDMTRGQTA